MQLTLYNESSRNKRGDTKSTQFILHFDDEEGFFIMEYQAESRVRAPKGNFIGVDEKEDQAPMSIRDFLRTAPPQAQENFRQALSRMFARTPAA